MKQAMFPLSVFFVVVFVGGGVRCTQHPSKPSSCVQQTDSQQYRALGKGAGASEQLSLDAGKFSHANSCGMHTARK